MFGIIDDCEEMEPFNSFFQIELIKREKQLLKFEIPLWVDSYLLEYNEEFQGLLSYASEKVIRLLVMMVMNGGLFTLVMTTL